LYLAYGSDMAVVWAPRAMVTCGRGLAFRRLLSCLVLALLTTASYFGPSCGYSLDFPSDDDVMVDVIAQRSLSRRSSTTILAQDELVLVEPGSGASADEGDEGHEDVRPTVSGRGAPTW
jgi:hypothetical protein